MSVTYLARSRWLAIHVLPHEPTFRAWLRGTARVSDADADDIVQETYAVLVKVENISAIRDPRAYALQTVRSIFLQGLRRSKVVTIEAFASLADCTIADEAPSPEQHANGQRELRRVEAAIATMPPQVRKVFWLRRVEGLSQRETAHRLALAEHTVEKYTAKGMKMLLRQFGQDGNGDARSSAYEPLKAVGIEASNARASNRR
ncbi:RNA polymerase sigma factor [Sphingomonas morindae]|uniref:Sigma-70 family RNA polymerase sigma factor n=1 Tax=Sphingomonas morindae TaxID=1541170 RepID=A0ABY4XEB1_9SPHN|nr:sigma-70 family RNA polymerase sigma factor [Sphingomonas morindae]USI75233.1 sigma-70 family RNA polymerase sigma factor [Sphingomonas morindae]